LIKIHIIHVGTMDNKGTQALLMSDVYLLKKFFKDSLISVSTTDVEGTKKLNLPLEKIVPTIVDIPFKRADVLSKKAGIERDELKYKFLIIFGLLVMMVQTFLSLFSALFTKVGLKPFYRGEVFRQIKTCDLVISCSDENFKESASILPTNFHWTVTWWSILFERMFEVLMVKFFGKPIIMFPNSVGPFKTRLGSLLSKVALNRFSYLLLRDRFSYETVKALGIHPPKDLTADVALLLRRNSNFSGKEEGAPLIGVSPGVYSHSLSAEDIKKYVMAHAVALDAAIEKYGFTVLFLPHYISGFKFDDLEISKLILQSMRNRDSAKIIETSSVDKFKSILEDLDILISSKMHPAVLGLSSFIPTLCIAYDRKQIGLFNHLNMMGLVVNMREVNPDIIFSKVSFLWKNKEEVRRLLNEKIPLLQNNTEKTLKRVLYNAVKLK